MAVLSDLEIIRRIAEEELILFGDPRRASECSYAFVPGAAFHPGSEAPSVTFPGEVIVKPGEMIWIRTKERVTIPKTLVGFWWQTNGLSRRGLMLVNMSMVEPGYQGDLACLFVNFGKSAVPISTDTPIAKMVFSPIQGEVANLFGYASTREGYDAQLRELSLNQPPSFLQIGDLAANVQAARAAAIADIQAEAVKSTAAAKSDISDQRTQALKDFKADIPKAIWQSAAWAVAALALLTAASTGADWIKGNLLPNVRSTARAEAEDVLRSRLSISAAPTSQSAQAIDRKLTDLSARLTTLERKH
jgi:deoxycytidine triphosphate deaminase